jgi:hypothetical protein
MGNFKIELDANKNVITLKFYGTVKYKTLLKSLRDLLTVYRPKDVHIVLDFSEIKSLGVSYRQITNFRDGLKVLFPKKTVGKISIINCLKNSYGDVICCTTPTMETEFIGHDLRCFESHKKTEAYQ